MLLGHEVVEDETDGRRARQTVPHPIAVARVGSSTRQVRWAASAALFVCGQPQTCLVRSRDEAHIHSVVNDRPTHRARDRGHAEIRQSLKAQPDAPQRGNSRYRSVKKCPKMTVGLLPSLTARTCA
jgi:hypothetical protein